MKKRSKPMSIYIIFIIAILLIGSMAYKNTSLYISSDAYLSSEEESKRTVYSMKNEEDTEDSKSFEFDKFTGKWSIIEFTSDKDNEITINDNTKINKGKFYIVVLDSDYNIIAKKDGSNESGDINFTTPESGKYIIRIVGKNASGNFNIKINTNNDIKISHKGFFE